ncbi:hypothetical protein SLE2022_147920 [Rubroshorea leprosula]
MHPSNYDAQNIHLQLMDDGGCNSSVFPISNSQNQNPHHSLYEPHLHHSHGSKPPDQIFRPPMVPVTYRLLQQHGFQEFHENERLHQHQMFHPYSTTVNFMGLNENSAGDDRVLKHQQDGTFLHHNRQNSLVMPNCWNTQEDPVIKEPFWKPLNRGKNKECSTEDSVRAMEGNEYNKPLQQADDCRAERCKDSSRKYRLFNELEAIWSLARFGEGNQTAASGSALTGENSPKKVSFSRMLTDVQGHNGGGQGGVANAVTGVDHGSETSIGEEASLRKIQKKKRKMKVKEQLSSMAGFFQSLVKQVIDHQEFLHRKFLEMIEKMEKERTEKEEAWRCQEAAKHDREALARVHEQAMASKREALIVSYLEKIAGQSINLPERTPLLPPEGAIEPRNKLGTVEIDTNSRWPRAEVEALIQIRSALESKFQEPGLKGPLWEEVSSAMASKGYQRSAKRCKEKWENINKYFRKSKESGKKRSQQSKTCSYFNQLDQLHSRTTILCPLSSSSLISSDMEALKQGDSEFLEAFISGRDLRIPSPNSTGGFKVSEMRSPRLDFEGSIAGNENIQQRGNRKDKESNNDDNGE